MTREKAIDLLDNLIGFVEDSHSSDYDEAIKLAIKALEQEPFINKPCVSEKVCEHDKNVVLDKIRAEILDEAEYAYADFDRYKEDILHAEPDELPDDDFRYGMERAVEIINKYVKESEDEA